MLTVDYNDLRMCHGSDFFGNSRHETRITLLGDLET